MGDVIGDLNSRRGMVEGFDDRPGGMKMVKSQVPLSEMFNYVSNLRSSTKGRGSYAMKLSTLPPPPAASFSRPFAAPDTSINTLEQHRDAKN